MSKYLAIDTSSYYLNVVAKNGDFFERKEENCAGSHSVKLLSVVEETLLKADMPLSSVDFFAVVTGAGSFTGIRIGIATVKGFCTGTEKLALPITSFEVIAYTIGEQSVLTVISAGHGYAYACGFDQEKKVILPPCYLSLEEIEKLQKEYAVTAGFEELPLQNVTKADMMQGLRLAVEEKSKDKENFIPCEELQALYVRKSQAEENRK